MLALLIHLAAMAVLSLVMVLAKLADRSGITLSQFIFWRQFIPIWLILGWLGARGELGRLLTSRLKVLTCTPDCYQSEVESGSFMMVG